MVGYKIEQSVNNGDFEEIDIVYITTYTNTNVSIENVYGYRIKAYSDNNISEPSEVGKIKWVVSSYSLLWSGTHNNDVFSAVISPNNNFVASGDGDFGNQNTSLKVWNLQTGGLIWEKEEYTHGVNRIAISPDNSRIAFTPNQCCGPYVLDANTGDAFFCGSFNGGMSAPVVFSPNNEKVAVTNSWSEGGISFSPDNSKVATSSSEVHVWDVNSGEELWNYEAEDNENKVRVLDSDSGQLLWSGNDQYYIFSVAFSPDNSKVVVGAGYSIEVWDVNTGNLMWTESPSSGGDFVMSVRISPDGTKAVSNSGGEVSLWDIETGNLIWSSSASYVWDRVSFSSDGTKVTSGSSVWDTDSGVLLWSGGHGGRSASFSPDDTKILSSLMNGNTISIYQEDGYEWRNGEW